MTRRERALRRLRERVDLDDSSLESGEFHLKGWGKRLFSSSGTTKHTNSMPMTPINNSIGTKEPPAPHPMANLEHADAITATPATAPTADSESKLATDEPSEAVQSPTPAAKKRPRKPRPRALNLLPTQPEDAELRTSETNGRHSPSSFARERMREIASRNAPFEDPDLRRPKCEYFLSLSLMVDAKMREMMFVD